MCVGPWARQPLARTGGGPWAWPRFAPSLRPSLRPTTSLCPPASVSAPAIATGHATAEAHGGDGFGG
eukprot:11166210-Lingulodinium_polyedra.AAC.1